MPQLQVGVSPSKAQAVFFQTPWPPRCPSARGIWRFALTLSSSAAQLAAGKKRGRYGEEGSRLRLEREREIERESQRRCPQADRETEREREMLTEREREDGDRERERGRGREK